MAGRAQVKGGETCLDGELARAGAYKLGPRDEEIAAAGRWKAFPWPLIFGNPEIKPRHYYQGAPSGVPPPSLLMRARSSEPPTHVKRFAGSDDARPEEAQSRALKKALLSGAARDPVLRDVPPSLIPCPPITKMVMNQSVPCRQILEPLQRMGVNNRQSQRADAFAKPGTQCSGANFFGQVR
jgi:hypothetical protein